MQDREGKIKVIKCSRIIYYVPALHRKRPWGRDIIKTEGEKVHRWIMLVIKGNVGEMCKEECTHSWEGQRRMTAQRGAAAPWVLHDPQPQESGRRTRWAIARGAETEGRDSQGPRQQETLTGRKPAGHKGTGGRKHSLVTAMIKPEHSLSREREGREGTGEASGFTDDRVWNQKLESGELKTTPNLQTWETTWMQRHWAKWERMEQQVWDGEGCLLGKRKLSFSCGKFDVFKHTLLKMSLQPSSGHCKWTNSWGGWNGENQERQVLREPREMDFKGGGQRPRHTERHEWTQWWL